MVKTGCCSEQRTPSLFSNSHMFEPIHFFFQLTSKADSKELEHVLILVLPFCGGKKDFKYFKQWGRNKWICPFSLVSLQPLYYFLLFCAAFFL